ncbi:MAG: nuclear transport factor 2 family protein [Gemmatimonadetes bacterium]|nr:nuclear transport factor 2 family protein [Gemmatimonadota bacterium]
MYKSLLLVLTTLVTVACEREAGVPEADVRGENDMAATQAARIDPRQAEQAIAEQNRIWLEGMESKNALAIANLFAEDGLGIYDGERFEGRDAILRDQEESFTRPNATGTFKSDRIVISESGDMAYDLGTYSGGYDGPDGRVENSGQYLTVWRKIGDEWKVAVDATSGEAPEAETSEDEG